MGASGAGGAGGAGGEFSRESSNPIVAARENCRLFTVSDATESARKSVWKITAAFFIAIWMQPKTQLGVPLADPMVRSYAFFLGVIAFSIVSLQFACSFLGDVRQYLRLRRKWRDSITECKEELEQLLQSGSANLGMSAA